MNFLEIIELFFAFDLMSFEDRLNYIEILFELQVEHAYGSGIVLEATFEYMVPLLCFVAIFEVNVVEIVVVLPHVDQRLVKVELKCLINR